VGTVHISIRVLFFFHFDLMVDLGFLEMPCVMAFHSQ
jgi:hypothetical protein